MSLTTSLSASQTSSHMAPSRVVPRKRTGSDYIPSASQHSDSAPANTASYDDGNDDEGENAPPHTATNGPRSSRRASNRTSSRGGEPMQHRSQPQELGGDSSVASSSGAASPPNGKSAPRRSDRTSSHAAATPDAERKRRRIDDGAPRGSIDAADVDGDAGEQDGSQPWGSEGDPEEDPDEADESMAEQKPITKSELGVNGHTGNDHPDRDADGFIPGSIVRVALENFVTYDSVEFQPGPHLNMIIGPNGTGKSTIVCAIALGLGWKPAILGRAKDVASFVKQGYEDGWIEIELKGKCRQRNVVIRRYINRKSNSSDWRLNGKTCTAKAISDAVAQFDISVDNLCTFLPQDKVAEFARMDPPKLLIETQRAAGHPKLVDWHAELIELGAQYREVKEKLDREQDEHNHLEQRNEVLGRDVERFEQRRKIEDEIALLNVIMPCVEYLLGKEKYGEAKLARNHAKAALAEMQEAIRPLEERWQDMRDKKNKMEDKRSKVAQTVSRDNKEMQKLRGILDSIETDMQDLVSSMDNLKTRDTERQKLLASLSSTIAQLEERVRDKPDLVDLSGLDEELREIRREWSQITRRRDEIAAEIDEVGIEGQRLQNEQDQIHRRLQQLGDERGRRLNRLKTWDMSTFKAVLWLRNNSNLFSGKVYEPVFMELAVADPRHGAAVENSLNEQQMRTFICETRADYDIFTREVIDKMKLRVNVAELEGDRSTGEYIASRPVSLEQIRSLGFDDFVSSYVSGPEAVLSYIFKVAQLHLLPVARTDQVRVEQVEQTRRINKYIIAGTVYTVQWSNYGRKLPTTMSRDMKPAQIFVRASNDAEKARLDAQMVDIARQLKDGEERVGALQERMAAREEELGQLRERKKALDEQRADAQQESKAWEKAKYDLQQKRERKKQEERKPSAEAEKQKLFRDIGAKTKKRNLVVKELTDLAKKVVERKKQQDILMLAELQHSVNTQAWKNAVQAGRTTQRELETALDEATADFTAAKQKATQLRLRAQARVDDASEEVRQRFSEKQREVESGEGEWPTIAELETQLHTQQGALELAAGVPEGVIASFKKRAEKIAQLKESINIKVREAAKKEDKIERIKSQWHPELVSLVSRVSDKFSAAFERIGCAGEVRISERGTKFEAWGIDILVKFRDTEQLQLLTAQRQSGGERSLSTILYLMSLTELSRSPFSLVDEINQGMDQRAERAVHDQMVEVTCQPAASQYFLITPKLLPDLRYDDKMKVLLINNGEWLPERLNLADIAARMRGASAAAGRSQRIAAGAA